MPYGIFPIKEMSERFCWDMQNDPLLHLFWSRRTDIGEQNKYPCLPQNIKQQEEVQT